MTDNQESGSLLEMEKALHQYVLGPWSADHAGRPGSAISQVEYDRDKYPEQRLDTYRTRMNILPTYLLPSRLLAVMIESKLADAFGSAETARKMVDSFRHRPASQTDSMPLKKRLSMLIDSGETISVVDTHAEFTGGIRMLAALSAAMSDRRMMRLNTTIISNTMTREEIDGKTIAELVSPVSDIVWVNPDTKSYDELVKKQKLGSKSSELVKIAGTKANAGAMRELKKSRSKGGLLQWAPFSSTVLRIFDDKDRLVRLKTPTLPSQAPGLLSRSRFTLPFAYWEDGESGEVKWAIGDLIDRNNIEFESKRVRDGIYLEMVIGELCTMLAEVSGVPVEHAGKMFGAAHQIDSAHPRNL
jgi:hypothetical protein